MLASRPYQQEPVPKPIENCACPIGGALLSVSQAISALSITFRKAVNGSKGRRSGGRLTMRSEYLYVKPHTFYRIYDSSRAPRAAFLSNTRKQTKNTTLSKENNETIHACKLQQLPVKKTKKHFTLAICNSSRQRNQRNNSRLQAVTTPDKENKETNQAVTIAGKENKETNQVVTTPGKETKNDSRLQAVTTLGKENKETTQAVTIPGKQNKETIHALKP